MPDLLPPSMTTIAPASRRRGSHVVTAAALLLALVAPGVHAGDSPAPASPEAPPITNCADAQRLPVEASDEDRRIACEIPEKYRLDVAMAQYVGSQLRLHDMAAWLTTDALVAKGAFKRMRGEGRGWLTLSDGDDIRVRYYSEVDGQVVAIAAARMDTNAVKATDAQRLSPAEPLDEREARLMKAKHHALESEHALCTRHAPNTVVLEADENGRKEIQVFVMSAWVDNRQAPLGGFHMFRYSADGQTQLDHFSQSRSCPMADLDAKPANGGELAALTVTHFNSATPTMFHVFLSLQYRKPLVVMTTQNKLVWKIEDGRVRLLEGSKPLDGEADGSKATQPDAGSGGDRTPTA